MAVDSRLLVDLFANIHAPISTPDYEQLYQQYLASVRYVADLFAKQHLLSDNCGAHSGLDGDSTSGAVVRQTEVFCRTTKEKVDVDSTCDNAGRDSLGGAGVGDKSAAGNDKQHSSNNGTIVPRVKVKTQARREREKRYKAKIKERKFFDNATGHGACVDARGNIDCSIARTNIGGLDSVQGAESSDSDVGFRRGSVRRGVRSGVSRCKNSCREEEFSGESVDNLGDMERRALMLDICASDSFDVQSDVGYSSEERARESYWKLRHVRNCMQLAELRQSLSHDQNLALRAEKRVTLDLVKRNVQMRDELNKAKLQYTLLVDKLTKKYRG